MLEDSDSQHAVSMQSACRITFSTLLHSFCRHALRFNSMIADKLNAEIAGAAKIDQPDACVPHHAFCPQPALRRQPQGSKISYSVIS